jgi:hypothetical protein
VPRGERREALTATAAVVGRRAGRVVLGVVRIVDGTLLLDGVGLIGVRRQLGGYLGNRQV